MAPLREDLEKSGNWLFRWRGFLPLLAILPMLVALKDFNYPFGSHRLGQLWEILCLSLSLLGFSIRFITSGSTPKGTSGRNTKSIKGDYLNTTGMYSIVRHPLYLGNFIISLGISLFFRSGWLILTFILTFWLYYERIMFAEEKFLREKFEQRYVEWARVTPTFIPKLKNWKPPALPFSFRTALRKEYNTFMVIIVSFFLLEIVGGLFVHGQFDIDALWLIIFFLSMVSFMILKVIDKKTKILKIPGR